MEIDDTGIRRIYRFANTPPPPTITPEREPWWWHNNPNLQFVGFAIVFAVIIAGMVCMYG